MASAGHALEQALAYYRAPALLAMAAQRPLPEDVIELLRLAAGDRAQAAASAEASGESPQRVAEAAVFFVQQVMFAADAEPHRVLGVNSDAPAARIREHYRWLIRWLHPDRNADEWDSVYTDRVTRAWQSLRRSGALLGDSDAGDIDSEAPVRRSGEIPAVTPAVLAASQLARMAREAPAEPMLSARTARQLPAFILGGLGLAAVSLVALIWYAQQNPLRTRGAAATPDLAQTPGPSVGGTSVPVAATSPDTPAPQAIANEFPPTEDVAPPPIAAIPPVGGTSVPIAATSPGTQAPQAVGNQFPPTEPAGEPAAQSAPNPVEPPVLAYERPATRPTPPAAAAAPTPPAPTRPAEPTAAAPPRTAAAPPARPVARATPPAATLPVRGPSGPKPSDQIAAAPDKSFGPEGPPTSIEATIEQASAHAVLDKFSTAYAAGDINALMRLFTRDAVNNRGGREAIAYDYQSLFSQSRERRLNLAPKGWITRDNGAVVLAAYEAWVREGRLRAGTTTRGDIRFTLRREDGELKISQVIHD
jgi:ketosteroid isomerase-like protein